MMDKSAIRTLATRTLTGFVLFVIVLACVLVSRYTFAALLMGVCVGGMWEFFKLAERRGVEPQKNYGIAVGAFAVAVNFVIASDFLSPEAWMGFTLLLALFFIIFINELYRKKENPIVNISVTIAGIMYIAIPLSLLAYISMYPDALHDSPGDLLKQHEYHPWVVLCYIFIVWANDVGAYLVGVTIGKRRLFERISPKKSWEGFFGGLVFAVACGLVVGRFLNYPTPGSSNMLFWGGLSLITVVTGVFGDLVESMLKRSVAIKDSGAVMPGHGGFLDRFDALLFSVPFVYVYFIIFAH